MRMNAWRSIPLFAAATMVLAVSSGAFAGETRKMVPPSAPRLALVIGNGNYAKLGRLDNPANDARLMADRLKAVGFEVTAKTDRDLKGMSDDIEDFARRIKAR